MRSGNPAFSESTPCSTSPAARSFAAGADAGTMTVNGTVNKTGLLLLLVVITGAYSWSQAFGPTGEINPAINAYLWGGMLAGFGLALATIFKKAWAPVTAPLYAIAQGFFLGAISAIYDARFDGIVVQAVILTFGTLFAMLAAYRAGLIKATEKFRWAWSRPPAGSRCSTWSIVLGFSASRCR